MNKKMHIKTGDTVFIKSGNERGKKGKVLEVSPKEGKVIVEGRNIMTGGHQIIGLWANAAYQGSRCKDSTPLEFAKWVFDMEEIEFQLPVPDLYLIFDVSPALSAQNVAAKGYRDYTGDSADVYEKSSSILTDARSLYREFAAMYDSMELLECHENGRMKSPEAIHQAVMDILTQRGLWKR